MRVTKPMIERGAEALANMPDEERALGGWAAESETVLRAALNDHKEKLPPVIEGQMTVDDFPEAFAGWTKSVSPPAAGTRPTGGPRG